MSDLSSRITEQPRKLILLSIIMFHAVYLVQRYPRFVPVCHVALNFQWFYLSVVRQVNATGGSIHYLIYFVNLWRR